jgi:hypothetical protein
MVLCKTKGSHLNRLLSKSLFSWSKTFFDKSKGPLQAMSKLAFGAQTVDIAYLPAKSFTAKNVLMTAQRDFRLGNNLFNYYDSGFSQKGPVLPISLRTAYISAL